LSAATVWNVGGDFCQQHQTALGHRGVTDSGSADTAFATAKIVGGREVGQQELPLTFLRRGHTGQWRVRGRHKPGIRWPNSYPDQTMRPVAEIESLMSRARAEAWDSLALLGRPVSRPYLSSLAKKGWEPVYVPQLRPSAVLSLLSGLPRLRHLALVAAEVGDEGARAIAANLGQLTSLDLAAVGQPGPGGHQTTSTGPWWSQGPKSPARSCARRRRAHWRRASSAGDVTEH
jgi:hypothetical protein